MVIEDREEHGKDESDAQPGALFLQEIKLIAVAVGSERTRAVQHHQSDRD